MRIWPIAVGLLVSIVSLTSTRADVLTFPGICDASAAIAIDEKTIIVGDDERRKLFVYDLHTQELQEKIPLPFYSAGSGNHESGCT